MIMMNYLIGRLNVASTTEARILKNSDGGYKKPTSMNFSLH